MTKADYDKRRADEANKARRADKMTHDLETIVSGLADFFRGAAQIRVLHDGQLIEFKREAPSDD